MTQRLGSLIDRRAGAALIAAVQQCVGATQIVGDLFAVTVKLVFFFQRVFLTRRQCRRFQFIDTIAQDIHALLFFRFCGRQLFQRAADVAIAVICRLISLPHRVVGAHFIEIGQMLCHVEKRLIFVLPVNVDEHRPHLAQKRHRRGLSVDATGAFPVGADGAFDEQCLIVDGIARLCKARFHRVGNIGKHSKDLCLCTARAHQIAPHAFAEHSVDSINENGFSGTRLTGQHVKAAVEIHIGFFDDRYIFNV